MIGPDSEQLGVVAIQRALALALEHELDLVEISPTASPPVCRIMDYSKYKYDQEKKERKSKRKQHVVHLKQLRLKPHIGVSDYQIKLRQAINFLDKQDKVKVNMFYRGREMAHKELGERVLERFTADLRGKGVAEKAPVFEGKVLYVVFNPNSDK